MSDLDRYRTHLPANRPRTTFALMAAVICLALSACSGEKSRLEAMYKSAPSAGRNATAISLRNAFYAKSITATAVIDLAHERLEKAAQATPPTPDPAAVAFAGAVLDFTDQAEPDLSPKVLNDFYWIRIGTLAANAATAARAAGDVSTARSLILAGPKRWQNEAYWRLHPAHDALASMILFESGEEKEALARLNERADLAEEVQEVKDTIEKEMRKRPRK